MKTKLDKLEEASKVAYNLGDAILNISKSIFYLAAASTFVYSSIHLHKMLGLSSIIKSVIGVP